MVRKYIKKSNRAGWNQEQLEIAINKLSSEGMAIKSVADECGIPRTTLAKKFRDKYLSSTANSGFKKVFTAEQEAALHSMAVDLEERCLGITGIEIRKLAYTFAEDLGIPHRFDHNKGMAGRDWLSGFLLRSKLSIRKPEAASATRASSFRTEKVDKFFNILETVMNRHRFPSSSIWTVDEFEVSVNPKILQKTIARRGKKQEGGKTSTEQGETITAVICYSAIGTYMPLTLIYPRVKKNNALLEGKPEGSWAIFNRSGSIEKEAFKQWLREFIKFSKATVDNPVLLILNGHVSHAKNLDVTKLGRDNGVVLLVFPPHCIDRMQPANVSFMQPLSNAYAEEICLFQRSGCVVQMKDVFKLIGKAWQKAAKADTAVKSFQTTGIHPVNRCIFNERFNIENNNSSSGSNNASEDASIDTEGIKYSTSNTNCDIGPTDQSSNNDFGICNLNHVVLRTSAVQRIVKNTTELSNHSSADLSSTESLNGLKENSVTPKNESNVCDSNNLCTSLKFLEYKNQLTNILTSNGKLTSTQSGKGSIPSNLQNADQTISIPLSVVLGAQPLISLLHSYLPQSEASKQPQKRKSKASAATLKEEASKKIKL